MKKNRENHAIKEAAKRPPNMVRFDPEICDVIEIVQNLHKNGVQRIQVFDEICKKEKRMESVVQR